MNSETIYQPHYENSWALVVGINDYQIASPLGYAKQGAEAFAEILITRHGFQKETANDEKCVYPECLASRTPARYGNDDDRGSMQC
jgi:hypothetical protein